MYATASPIVTLLATVVLNLAYVTDLILNASYINQHITFSKQLANFSSQKATNSILNSNFADSIVFTAIAFVPHYAWL